MALTRAYAWDAPDVGEADDSNEDAGALIRVGLIGLGVMGSGNLEKSLNTPNVRVTALCEVDALRLAEKADHVMESQPDTPFLTHSDFRELNRDPNVDAVIISTPDHWHAWQGIDAMQAGKDVYIEKPLTLTVDEGRKLSDTAQSTGRICQTGSQQRSSREFRHACELIRNGYLGEIERVEFTIPPNNRTCGPVNGPEQIPEHFDYDMWLGPAPDAPYLERRCHYSFRFSSDYSGGQMTNWGTHMLDIIQWALDADGSGPIHVAGTCTFTDDGIYNTADQIDLTWTYPGDIPVRCSTTTPPSCRFIGSKGELYVGRGHLETTPPELAKTELAEGDLRLERSNDHFCNFLNAVHTREQPICNAEVGHRSASVCHIGNIALKLGRALDWDPAAERFVDDDEANGMLARVRREPWTL